MLIRPRSLLDQITLQHGPHDLLGRYLILADRAARQMGVRLRLRSDFERLHEIKLKHFENTPMMSPIFDPAQSNLRIDSSFWVEGVNDAGDTISTHAARLFDWPRTTLESEARALRVHYEDPAPHLAAGESVDITAPSASRIRGRTTFAGAMWVRADYRRQGLTRIIPRISRVYAYTRWNTAFTWGFMEPRLHAGGASVAYGRYTVEDGLTVRLDFRSPFRAMLLWMAEDTMLGEIEAFIDQPTSDLSRSIEMPSTSESSRPRRQGSRIRS